MTMRAMPEDLKQVHQKYEELCQANGRKFALGFLIYMVEVDYHKGEPQQVLMNFLWTWHADKVAQDIADLLTQRVASDFVQGFTYAQTYSQHMQDRYGLG